MVNASIERTTGGRRDVRARLRTWISWRAVIATSKPGAAFELRLTEADSDWLGTSVGFEL